MSLDSSGSHSISNISSPWVFLFVHRMRVDQINQKLSTQFETFIHKSIICHRREKSIVKKEQQTIAGLIFVHGDAQAVQSYLRDNLPFLHLVKDFATRQAAQIRDAEMQQFMRLSAMGERSVRFLLHPIDYYAVGNRRIRITDGPLAGCEGYIVRIARDRKLVTTIGNMTVAISGVNKDSFENAEEYVREVKRLKGDLPLATLPLTPMQQEIDRCFFTTDDDIDIMALSKAVEVWHSRASVLLAEGALCEAAEICLTVFEEIGARLPRRSYAAAGTPFFDMCQRLDAILTDILAGLPPREKADVQVERDSLMLRYAYLLPTVA